MRSRSLQISLAGDRSGNSDNITVDRDTTSSVEGQDTTQFSGVAKAMLSSQP